MATLTQKKIDKMKEVTLSELIQTTDKMRNYVVYVGEKFATHFEVVHCSFDIEKKRNHFEIISSVLNGQPIYKVKAGGL
jgi:hypothetical protein